MIGTVISVFLATLILCPPAGFAEEPVPPEGFIEITDDVLDTFDRLEKDARIGNFNQLRNPGIKEKFDKIRSGLIQYEGYVMDSVYNWPEGRQKHIASELHEVNFLYRAYSLSEHSKFRQRAEDRLQKARDLYYDYVRYIRIGKEG